ncbi:hypothetical protein BEH_02425 [Priestia filamentosa]|uniref:Uncharacterized protein n=1 Tax=Priestia filamentosa TaxID=1402861 RepID=A0A231S487_9BACI|nr:hypothetical protein BEH_02425 [Priestia filamentosa]AVD54400.1 hypothetical protein CKF96_02465 [Priestia filamentosa]OXS66224.1 hypothetical protein B1B01_19780 [Priestia filamentosa]RJS65564.1 hypothetical protein CJ485_12690 [Priestia filamentosa]
MSRKKERFIFFIHCYERGKPYSIKRRIFVTKRNIKSILNHLFYFFLLKNLLFHVKKEKQKAVFGTY